MAHIKESKGVDFIINSRPLTKAEELAISEHIKNYKLKNNIGVNKPTTTIKKRKVELVD
jgi:hypothetical protein